jgi:hypothetical protein
MGHVCCHQCETQLSLQGAMQQNGMCGMNMDDVCQFSSGSTAQQDSCMMLACT